MCGIAGFSGNFNKSLLSNMNALIAHRGPDDAGEIFFSANGVGLAHCRLSIIDLSVVGRQPMTSQCALCPSGLWLTYNGELYNYRELRSNLIAKGHQFHSQTDTEVLLHLYAEYGVNMLQHLNGMFAFALFDGKELLIVRDGIGIKPLYYCEIKGSEEHGFLFASELKALLACKALARSLDYTAIHYYLAYLWCPGKLTALKNVYKVEPGQALLVRDGHIVKRWFFYDLPYGSEHDPYLSHASVTDICIDLHERLLAAVNRQMMADVPIGAFLSGGLDSSAVVAMMQRINPDVRFNCYTIAFDESMQSEGNPNDLPYAQKVARKLNMKLTVLTPKADMINHLQKMIYHLDEPQADLAPIHVYQIAQAAKRDGIKVLLSGTGGDDIFSGYRRHRALQASRRFHWIPIAIRKKFAYLATTLLAAASSHSTFNMHHHLLRRSTKFFSALSLPIDQQIIHHFLWSSESLRYTLYSNTMREALHTIDSMQPLLYSLQRIPAEKQILNRMLYLEGKHFLADHNLNYTDKMSMAAGIEVRVPLLDLELIRFATRLPQQLKQRGKHGKYIFKKTLETTLPHEVIYRPKAGFGAPLRRWLHHELKPLVDDVLSATQLQKRGLFDANAVKQLIHQDQSGKIDASYTIFSLLTIELWCQQFLDRNLTTTHAF